jgi:mannose-6-phosphate isomerase-like protein (cupin superfamily)
MKPMQVQLGPNGSPLNRPSSLEDCLRKDFHEKKHAIKMSEVKLEPVKGTEGCRSGWYDFASQVVAWGLTEMSPGGAGPMHRQLCESTMFVLEGEGYTVVNGRRFDWKKGDVLFVPLFAWHQHVNTGQSAARYARMSTAPIYKFLGLGAEENLSPPTSWNRADEESGPLGKVLLKYEEGLGRENWEKSRDGQTVTFDFHYRIPTTRRVPSRIMPNESGGMHRHASEAQIFIYQGKGFSTLNEKRVEWEAGDVVRVPLFAWHQHTNTGDEPAIWLKHTSAALYKQIGLLMRDARPGFSGRDDISEFKDDFAPY